MKRNVRGLPGPDVLDLPAHGSGSQLRRFADADVHILRRRILHSWPVMMRMYSCIWPSRFFAIAAFEVDVLFSVTCLLCRTAVGVCFDQSSARRYRQSLVSLIIITERFRSSQCLATLHSRLLSLWFDDSGALLNLLADSPKEHPPGYPS